MNRVHMAQWARKNNISVYDYCKWLMRQDRTKRYVELNTKENREKYCKQVKATTGKEI